MKCLLEAFLSQNFGDDLFVTLLVRHYPQEEFFLIDPEGRAAALAQGNALPNLHSIQEEDALAQAAEFSAYFFVGGDFYGPHDHAARRARIQAVQAAGGQVFLLGGSLYKTYPDWSLPFMEQLLRLPDLVTFRDATSLAQGRQLCPGIRARRTCDMAFTLWDQYPRKAAKAAPIRNLGMSVREKWGGSEEGFEVYCRLMADTAALHLSASRDNTITFLNLSTWGFDDRQVAAKITALLPESLHSRIHSLDYTADVTGFIRETDRCDGILCTRFHSLCLALILGKPFAVIDYEAKTGNLLKDLRFQGTAFPYGEPAEPAALLASLGTNAVDPQALEEYAALGSSFFRIPDLQLGKEALSQDAGLLREQLLACQALLARCHKTMEENQELAKLLAQEKQCRYESDQLLFQARQQLFQEQQSCQEALFQERQSRFDTAALLSQELGSLRSAVAELTGANAVKAALRLQRSLQGSLEQINTGTDALDQAIARLWK